MRERLKTRNNIIIGALLTAILFMGVAYALFTGTLRIGSTANVSSKWNIHITNVTATPTGDASDTEFTYNGLSATLRANLVKLGDTITYNIDVKNDGNIDAYLEDINKTINISNEDMISVEITGFTKGEVLAAKQTKTMVVTVTFKDVEYWGLYTEPDTASIHIDLLFSQQGGSDSIHGQTLGKYLVTYNCTQNGGTACTDNNEYLAPGEDIDLTKKAKDTEEEMFVGWNTDSTATEALSTISPIDDNITLYAIYSQKPLLANAFLTNGTALNENITKANITSIDIVDLTKTNIPAGATSWDASANENESVTAWVVDDPNNDGKYKLYIGGNNGVIAPENSEDLFKSFSAMTSISLTLLDTSNVTNMDSMFYGCKSLTSLDVSKFNTSKVINMAYMFARCSGLTSLDLRNFDTSKVTDMSYMFGGYASGRMQLGTGLNITGWDTSKVTKMDHMFIYNDVITSTSIINSLNTSKVETFAYMFQYCTGLVNVTLSNIIAPELTNMSYMFNNCSNLESITISNINAPQLDNINYLFNTCKKLTTVNLSNITSSNIENMQRVFYNCTGLVEVDLSAIENTESEAANVTAMFYGCTNLETIYATDKFIATSGTQVFYNCKKLKGGSGTTWPSNSTSYVNYTRAKIDSAEEKGYFTDKNQAIMIDSFTNTPTTNSITSTVVAHSKNENYAITKYEFSIDDGSTWIESLDGQNNPNNTYRYSNLVNGSSYKVLIRITNSNNEVLIYPTGTTTTLALTAPTFTETTVNNQNVVQITYSDGCTGELTCTYQINEDTPVTVNSSPTNVNVSSNGTLTATISDGQSSISSTYKLISDPIIKSWKSSDTTDFHGEAYKTNITSVDFVDLNNTSVPAGATSWDVSNYNDGSIMAWVIDDPNNTGKYKLYIGGDTKVYANPTTSNMFYGFTSLTSVNNSSLLDFSHATTTNSMFYGCTNLTTIDTSNWNLSKVTNIGSMFYNCSSLNTLNVANWNVSNVTSMYSMFYGCTGLTTLNVSNWNVSNVTSMSSMFYGCTGLTTLDVSNWDISKLTDAINLFQGCSGLTTLNVSNWNTSKITDMYQMFNNCSSLTTLDVSKWNVSSATRMSNMFNNCSSLTTLDVSKWDVSKVSIMYYIFGGCSSLTTLDVSKWNTSKVTNLQGIFYHCSNVATIDVSNWDTSKVTYYTSDMFNGCSSLTNLDLSSFNTTNVTSMSYTFSGCTGLTTLDLSSWNTSNTTSMSGMFNDCTNLATIYVSDSFNISKVTSSSYMFSHCTSLVGGNGTTFNSSYIDKTRAIVDGDGGAGYFTDGEKPTIRSVSTSATTNTITATVTATMAKNNLSITKYEFSINDGLTWFDNGASNIYTFTGLASGVTYNIKVRVTGSNNYTNEKEVVVKGTSVIETPMFTENDSTVTITYLAGCGSTYLCKYTKDNEPSVIVTNKTVDVNFSESGTIVATITDGNVDASSSYTFAVVPTIKSWSSDATTDFHNSTYKTKIKSVEVLSTIDIPEGATSWDVSAKGDNSIVAWVINDPNSTSYFKLYIAGNGGVYANPNSSNMFNGFTALETIDLSNFNTSKVTNMSYMFANCTTYGKEINLSNWDTSKVTDMSYMFYKCYLSTLDIDSFNTSKVTNMSNMFYYCGLNNLNLSNFNTSKVTDMSYMFYYNYFSNLDLSNFNTSKVTNMSYMFYDDSLKNLDLSSFDTSKVTDMSYMFYSNSWLESLDLSSFNTSNVTDMSSMFCNNERLHNINLSNWDTSKVTNMSYMFDNVGDAKNCELTELDLSSFDTSSVTNMSYMFTQSGALQSIDLSYWDVSNVTTMNNMFESCIQLTYVNFTGWGTSKVTNLGSMFSGCKNITDINLSNFNTPNATSMGSMFINCQKLVNLSMPQLNTSNVTSMVSMFSGCVGLETINLSNFDTSNVTSMASMFSGCVGLETINLSNFDTSNVTSMASMFSGCSGLTILDLSSFDTSKLTDTGAMFKNCTNLTTIYVSNNFVTTNIETHSTMFQGCTSIVGGNGTTYSQLHMDKSYAKIDVQGNPGYFSTDTLSLSISTTHTSKSITVVATAESSTGIEKYEFSKDGGSTWTDNGTNNTIVFDNLTHNTTYQIQAKVTSGTQKTETQSTSVRTTQINTPTYSMTTSGSSKIVTITYPDGCTNYTCQYSVNSASSWTTSTTSTKTITFTESGSVIARVTDGKNTLTASTYTVIVGTPITLGNNTYTLVTSGNGLHADPVQSSRYVFEGSNPIDNYICLDYSSSGTCSSNYLYRIVAIEPDNTIKIVKNTSVGNIPWDTGLTTSISGITANGSYDGTRHMDSGYCSINQYGCKPWGSSTSTLDSSGNHVTTMPRIIGGTELALPAYDSYVSVYLNGGTYPSNNADGETTLTGWITSQPTVLRNNIVTNKLYNIGLVKSYSGQDLATDIQQESSYKWEGKVGLINATDYVRANSDTTNCGTVNLSITNAATCKATNWLYNSSTITWTMTPSSSSRPDDPWAININSSANGALYGCLAYNSNYLTRPVMYLKSTTTLRGSGTNDADVYRISS